jgi:hypothetical protein
MSDLQTARQDLRAMDAALREGRIDGVASIAAGLAHSLGWHARGEGEHCQSCGRTYGDMGWWKTDDELWARVTGRSDGSGLRCPDCFGREARAFGIELEWVARAEAEPTETAREPSA